MPATADVIEPVRASWYRRAFPALYALLVVGSLIGALVYKLRIEGIFACPASGYAGNAYLSDCNAATYGDYDHGAFWFGLEDQARRAAAAADVLLVGSSRLQFAFSGSTVANWFSAPNISYYLLGFSYSETVVFFEPLLARIQPRAKAYVINVDRFFEDRTSPPVEQILHSRDALQRYNEKQGWQSLHKELCNTLPAACGKAIAVYRSRDTGAWQRLGSGHFDTKRVSDGKPSNAERWDRYAELGRKFVAQLPVDRRCIILTIVPTVETKRAEAKAIADKLGLELLAPELDGLRTFDGSHLDEPSAERWSAAFMNVAGPRIRQCVAGRSAAAG